MAKAGSLNHERMSFMVDDAFLRQRMNEALGAHKASLRSPPDTKQLKLAEPLCHSGKRIFCSEEAYESETLNHEVVEAEGVPKRRLTRNMRWVWGGERSVLECTSEIGLVLTCFHLSGSDTILRIKEPWESIYMKDASCCLL